MKLFQLVYVSDAAIGFQSAGLVAISRSSKRNNQKVEVTGLLLYGGGSFLQMLEGDAANVVNTFQRVERDPRHARVQTLFSGPAHHRMFSEWSMGVLNVDEHAAVDRERLAAVVLRTRMFAKGTGPAPDEAAIELLRDFRLQLATTAQTNTRRLVAN